MYSEENDDDDEEKEEKIKEIKVEIKKKKMMFLFIRFYLCDKRKNLIGECLVWLCLSGNKGWNMCFRVFLKKWMRMWGILWFCCVFFVLILLLLFL